MTEDTLILAAKLDRISEILSKGGPSFATEKAPKTANQQPREVVEHDKGVVVNKLGDDVKKFFSGLFKFEAPEVKKEMTKKSSFWMTILELLAGALLGLWLFFDKQILPLFKRVWSAIEGPLRWLGTKMDELWTSLKSSKLWQKVEDFFVWIGRLFEEDGAIGRFFKEGTWGEKIIAPIKALFKSIGEIFSVDGKLGKLFAETKDILNLWIDTFKAGKAGNAKATVEFLKGASKAGEVTFFQKAVLKVSEFFTWFGSLFTEGTWFDKVLTKVKFFGKIFEKVAVLLTPIFAISDLIAGYKDEISKSGSKLAATMKGFMAFFVNIITLGFINFEDVKNSINSIVNKFKSGGSVFEQLADGVLLIAEAIVKVPAFIISWIVGWFSKDAKNSINGILKELSLVEAVDDFFKFVFGFWIDAFPKIKDTVVNWFTTAADAWANNILKFFSWIKDINFTAILTKIPGYDSFLKAKNWLTSKTPATPEPVPVALPAPKIAQDFISRPGQSPMQFTSNDTVLGLKSGGPIEKLLSSSTAASKQLNEITVKAYNKYNELLEENNVMLGAILEALQANTGNNPVLVNNAKTTSISIGELSGPSRFRNNVVS